MLPYPIIEGNIDEPTFVSSAILHDKVDGQTQSLNHFQKRLQREHLTSFREACKASGTTSQTVNAATLFLYMMIHSDYSGV